MGKYRTREQKKNPHHHFALSLNPDQSQAHVKGQKNIGYEAKMSSRQGTKNAENMVQAGTIKIIRRDIVKSLILVSFILCLELVVYLAWK